MKVTTLDFVLGQLALRMPRALTALGDMESTVLRRKLQQVAIERPVFVAGIARSGTTLLLNLCAKLPGVATHRYRDFPFLHFPVLWAWFFDRFGKSAEPYERPHKDRISITSESPEAYEEPIWTTFFGRLHDPSARQLLTADDRDPAFDQFFRDHIRKILYLRKGVRYVSKGNYNLSRIPYLASLFPDARFIIPVREPLDHVVSLVRQHKLFCEYARRDARVGKSLAAAGHFEFGPQRSPINFDALATQHTLAAWSRGQDALGYAMQWAAGYRYVTSLLDSGHELAGRIKVVRYEDLCSSPAQVMSDLLTFSGLSLELKLPARDLEDIRPPDYYASQLTEHDRREVARETAEVAARFGYSVSPE